LRAVQQRLDLTFEADPRVRVVDRRLEHDPAFLIDGI
jgi:hypothetical protein